MRGLESLETIYLENTDSTQLRAKELLTRSPLSRGVPAKQAGCLTVPFCIVADTQTGGYGQARRPYYCPQGGLYMSLVLPERDLKYKFPTGFVAVCVARVVGRALQKIPFVGRGGTRAASDGVGSLSIKWVNDILLGGKKVGGVLIEKSGSHFIIGIALNLFQTEPVPEDLRERMEFLFSHTPSGCASHPFVSKGKCSKDVCTEKFFQCANKDKSFPSEIEGCPRNEGGVCDFGVSGTRNRIAADIIREISLSKMTDEQVLAEYKKLCDFGGSKIGSSKIGGQSIDGLNIDGSLNIIGADGKLTKKFSNL